MSGQRDRDWYLVRTKPHKERWVYDQLAPALPEVFLPRLRTTSRRRGRAASSIVPLFACYLFAKFDLADSYFEVKYTPGVQGLVSAGIEPLAVPAEIVDEIRSRGIDGVVEIKARQFFIGEKVQVVGGPFHDFEAIFERYISGPARVAILLETVEARGIRVVLPADFLSQER